jgi:hypothetical protein
MTRPVTNRVTNPNTRSQRLERLHDAPASAVEAPNPVAVGVER